MIKRSLITKAIEELKYIKTKQDKKLASFKSMKDK